MIIVRSVTIDDFKAFAKLAFTAQAGMMSMPKNHDILYDKIQRSVAAYSSPVKSPGGELYLFVLESLTNETIGGSCGIRASTGVDMPHYYYKMGTEHYHCAALGVDQQIATLTAESYRNGSSEVCSLYLLPRFRGKALGRLLSLSRFLFMAIHPQRFQKTVFALMRGVINHNGQSVFWEKVGCHFCPMDFKDVLKLLESDQRFISDFVPRHPIYVSLLSSAVQNSLGKVHPNTTAAWQMLADEGFSHKGDVDIFDGGARLSANTDEIRTIREHRRATVGKVIATSGNEAAHIVANEQLSFRACYGAVDPYIDGTVAITDEVAQALQVHEGDIIRYVEARARHDK